jgi:CRP-like cAMP-binding protein
MYVVLAGSVKLAKSGAVVAELSRGHHFGEMSLVDRSVRSLTATATEGTRLVVIHRKDFYEIIKREPALATKMLWSFVQVLGQRLRKTTNDLSDALHGDRHGEETEAENLFQD